MLIRSSELNFKGNKSIRWPRIWWFSQILEDEERKKPEENQKGKIVGKKEIGDILFINPYKMERMLKTK
jgi:hypothetical protein